MKQTIPQQSRVARPKWGDAMMLAIGFVFLLPVTWISIYCHCFPTMATPESCHQSVPPDSAGESQPKFEFDVTPQKDHTHALVMNSNVGNSFLGTRSCCNAAPPNEVKQITISAFTSPTIEVNDAPPLRIQAQRLTPPLASNDPPRKPPRPLYLAFSCWLI